MQPLTLREIKLFLENFGSMFFVSHRRLVARCLKHPCLVQWYIRVGTMQVRPCWYNASTSTLVQCKYVHVGTMQVRPLLVQCKYVHVGIWANEESYCEPTWRQWKPPLMVSIAASVFWKGVKHIGSLTFTSFSPADPITAMISNLPYPPPQIRASFFNYSFLHKVLKRRKI